MDLTLFELHLDDASFTANAPFTGSDGESTDIDVRDDEASEDSTGPSPIGFVVGLVFLVGVGLAVRRLMRSRGGPDEASEESTAEPITA